MNDIYQIDPDDVTVLIGADAALAGGLRVRSGNHMRLYTENWQTPRDRFAWRVHCLKEDDYTACVVLNGEEKVYLEMAASNRDDDAADEPLADMPDNLFDGEANLRDIGVGWERRDIGKIHLKPGIQTLILSSRTTASRPMLLHAVELIRDQVKKQMSADAELLRSDPSWLGSAGYGVMFQWTNRTTPQSGVKKEWPRVVDDFDVEKFTKMIVETGAGYVIWTASWGPQYLPALLLTVDSILPGRTSERDLLGDLMESLGRHNIPVILYYHSGYDCYHSIDREWFDAVGGYRADKSVFFANICLIVQEMGLRYRDRLAGWFFDGASRYYDPRYEGSPPLGANHIDWQTLTKCAKTGNQNRIVTYNSWIKPKLTEFQDFFAGEGYQRNEHAPVDGSGIIADGPQKGLQAHTTFPLETEWGHLDNEDIAPPKYSAAELIDMVKDGISRRNAVTINMETYEDGSVSPASLKVLEALRKEIRGI